MTLNEGLRELAQERGGQAGGPVEAVLLREFRRRKRKRLILPGLAIAATVFLGALLLRNPTVELPPVPRISATRPSRPVIGQASIKPPVVARSVSLRRHTAPMVKPAATQSVGVFYPLPEAETLAPLEYGTVIRVLLPREALTKVGFAINEERRAESIQADVLLGQDGRARAVRFLE